MISLCTYRSHFLETLFNMFHFKHLKIPSDLLALYVPLRTTFYFIHSLLCITFFENFFFYRRIKEFKAFLSQRINHYCQQHINVLSFDIKIASFFRERVIKFPMEILTCGILYHRMKYSVRCTHQWK